MLEYSHIPYWRLSGFYFFYFATLGALLPYWGLYLQSIGFSAMEIGELIAILVGTKVIAPNMCGWVADRSGHSMRIIRIASFLATVIFAAILFARGYIEIALVTFAFSFFWNAALPQFEVVTLAYLRQDTHRYSLIRIGGSIGFVLAVLGVGQALDIRPIADLPLLLVLLLAAIWLMSLWVPEIKPPAQPVAKESLFSIVSKPSVIALLLVVFLVQAAHGPYYAFFSIFLTEHGYSGFETGLLFSSGVVAEVVLFLFMQRLLKRYRLRHILIVSVALGIVRWPLLALGVHDIAWLFIGQLLHAATFGACHVAAIHLVHQYFGEQHQGKGQALYSSLSFGAGGMVGSFYSGALWDTLGADNVYLIAALVSWLAWVIAWFWVDRDVLPESIDNPENIEIMETVIEENL